MSKQNLRLADLGLFERQQAIELARDLKADVIVTGKVHAYRNSWFFFVSLTTIEFHLWATDAASGEELWEARFRDAEIYGKDTDMLALAARKIGNKLKAGLAERAEVGP